jgi:hypothetical protein
MYQFVDLHDLTYTTEEANLCIKASVVRDEEWNTYKIITVYGLGISELNVLI